MIGYIALFTWPFVVMLIFKKRSPAEALVWALVGGYLLLPTRIGINLPLLPSFNKGAVTSLSALVFAAGILRAQTQPFGAAVTSAKWNMDYVLEGWLPRSKPILLLIGMFFVGVFGTALTNSDVQIYGIKVMQRLSLYDGFSMAMIGMMTMIPLILGRKFMGHPDAQLTLLKVLCLAGLVYSLPALFEARMSPQLNRWVYGFTTQNWIQGARGGGWRPTVFLPHGLILSLVFVMCCLAAVTVARSVREARFKYLFAAGWLFMTVIMCNSLGALIIAILLLPIALFLSPRLQMLIAAGCAGIILTYPLLRATDTMPVDRIVQIARGIDQERAGSLAYRIENEDILLERASERPVFGWGGWSRSRVFDEQGRDVSVTDGLWVIYLGVGGWVGYITQFGLVTVPMILLAFRRRGDPPTLATAGVAIVLTANLIDMIPNSSVSILTWFLGGALIGRLEFETVTRSEKPADTQTTAPRYSRYSRVHNGPERGNSSPASRQTGT